MNIISEYRNTKVAALTPRQPLISRTIAVLIVAFAMITTSLLTSSESWSPKIHAKFTDDLAVDYFLLPTPSLMQCRRVTEEFSLSVTTACPTCEVTAECPSGDHFLSSISSLHPHTVVAAFSNGVAAYNTSNTALAQDLCVTSSALENTIRCIKSNQNSEAVYTGLRQTRDGWLLLTGLLSTLCLIVIAAHIRCQHIDREQRVLSGHRYISGAATLLTDLISINLAWLSSAHGLWISQPLPPSRLHDSTTLLVAVGLIGALLVYRRHYARRVGLYDEIIQCVTTILIFGLIHIAINAYNEAAGLTQVALIWLASALILPSARFLVRALLDDLDMWRRPVVVIGVGANASSSIKAVTNDFTLGYKVLGAIDPEAEDSHPASLEVETGLPLISMKQMDELSEKVEVLIAMESMQSAEAQQIVQRLVTAKRRVHLIPSLHGLPLMGMQVSHFFSHNLLMLTLRNNLSRLDFKLIKRAFDLIASSLGLVILAPLFAIIALRIKTDGGPAFFGHQRVGRDGKPFMCLKFRSMHVDSEKLLNNLLKADQSAREEWQRDFKLKDDPRITKVGKFIRETSIDELPQLINVFKGEMSLVGPRPVIADELDRYGPYKQFYLQVRPGITGLWQVSGRSDTSYDERVGLDVWYTQNWALIYDIAILFKTFEVVAAKRGAY